MKLHSNLSKQQIMKILFEAYENAFELRENAICGDDEKIANKYDCRYQSLKEVIIKCKIYTLLGGLDE